MAQEKEMNTQVLDITAEKDNGGKIVFAPDVIATIAGLAATSIEGVAGMSGGVVDGITELLGRKNLTKGIKVEVGTEEVAVDVSVAINYGKKIKDVCVEIQKAIKDAVETMTGLRVVEVNVYVQAVIFEKPDTKKKPEKAEKELVEAQPRVK